MQYSINEYVYTGGAQEFDINFALGFDRADVNAQIKPRDLYEAPIPLGIVWLTNSRVRLTPDGAIEGGRTVQIQRTVAKDKLPWDFTAPDAVRRESLNYSFTHLLYAIHELLDGRAQGVGDAVLASRQIEEWYEEFKRGVYKVQQVFETVAGKQEYLVDRAGNKLNLTGSNQTVFCGEVAMGPLVLGDDYEVIQNTVEPNYRGIRFLKPVETGWLVNVISELRASDSEAQAMIDAAQAIVNSVLPRAEAAAGRAEIWGARTFANGEDLQQNTLTRENTPVGAPVFLKGGAVMRRVEDDTADYDEQDDNGLRWKADDGVFITPDLFARGGVDGDSYAILKARDAVQRRGRGSVVIPSGDYKVSEAVDIDAPFCGFEFLAGARFVAQAGFNGSAMLRVGYGASDVVRGVDLTDVKLEAGGYVGDGIHWYLAREGRYDRANIKGVTQCGVRVGSDDAVRGSYEVSSTGAHVTKASGANPDSTGIIYEQCTDSYLHQAYTVGFARGIVTDIGSGSVDVDSCHVWAGHTTGLLLKAFDIRASGGVISNCFADTPMNYLAPEYTDLIAFNLYGYGAALINCKVFINTSYPDHDIATDGLVKAVHFERDIFGSVDGLNLLGASASKRYKSVISGLYQGSHIRGIITPSPTFIADADTVRENVPSFQTRRVINAPTRYRQLSGASTYRIQSTDGSAARLTLGRINDDVQGDRVTLEATSSGHFQLVMHDPTTGARGKTVMYIDTSTGEVSIANSTTTLAGTWENPLRLGTLRLWNNAGSLYKKNSAPTGPTDGTLIA